MLNRSEPEQKPPTTVEERLTELERKVESQKREIDKLKKMLTLPSY